LSLSDRYGRKPLFVFSVGGTFLSLLLLGFANTLPLVFLSRILDGLTGGNITVAQSYIVDITDDRNRAKGFGIIGMAFGLGFIVGPLFGGLLSRYGLSVPAFAAAAIAGTNLLLISFVLPESLSAERKEELKLNPRRGFSAKALLETLRRWGTGPVLHMTLVYSFAFTLFESMFALFAAEALGIGSTDRAWLLAYIGVLMAIVQGGGVGALLLYSIAPSVPALLVVLVPLSFSSGVSSVMLRALLTKSVPRESAGGTLGLASAVESLNRVIAPLSSGLLMALLGPRAPGMAAAAFALWTAWFGWRKLINEDCLADGGSSCADPVPVPGDA